MRKAARRYSLERKGGFCRELAAAGREARIFQLETRLQSGPIWNELGELYTGVLRELPRPCGVFAADDLIAHSLLRAARELGLRVPRDLAVIGFNGQSHFCQSATPPLSSVNYPGHAIGRIAAETLFSLMRGGRPPGALARRVPVAGVTIRESTNVLAIRDPLVAEAVRLIRGQAAVMAPRVGEIAGTLGVSPSLLRQRFLDALGISPKEMVDRARTDIIRHWLATSELGSTEIATKTGFSEASELRRFFRRGTGLTPREYRQSLRKPVP